MKAWEVLQVRESKGPCQRRSLAAAFHLKLPSYHLHWRVVVRSSDLPHLCMSQISLGRFSNSWNRIIGIYSVAFETTIKESLWTYHGSPSDTTQRCDLPGKIWIKIKLGGDKGPSRFIHVISHLQPQGTQFCPEYLHLAFQAGDTISNLRVALDPYQKKVNRIENLTWRQECHNTWLLSTESEH